jgi:hypothetical protein
MLDAARPLPRGPAARAGEGRAKGFPSALLRLAATLLAGLAGGLALTFLALQNDLRFDRVENGPWSAWLRPAGTAFDPYARANLARTGELPLTLGEGIMLVARTDSAGAPLDLACRYSLAGVVPAARLWTLAAYRPDGMLAASPAGRHHLTSAQVLRQQDGAVAVRIGRETSAGNWLPVSGRGAFVLVLRLYDSPLSASSGSVRLTRLPAITREGCAP